MSAGGLSYSAITSSGRVSLPSVETWGNNMKIKKDPPKSIHTRRINRVGDTNAITHELANSESRTSEAILKFARGVNPMTDVSYSNISNNGGSSVMQRSSGTSAFLPNRIIKDGDFKPPVKTREELYPLSRQPRKNTKAFTKITNIDFSKRVKNLEEDSKLKEVREQVLDVSARPTAVMKVERPHEKPFEVKYVIQDKINVSGKSGKGTRDITQKQVQLPYSSVNYDNMHVYANATKTQNKYVNNSKKDIEPYIQDIMNILANTNVNDNKKFVNNNILETQRFLQENLNSHINVDGIISSKITDKTPIEDILDLSLVKTQNVNNIDYTTNKILSKNQEYIHDELVLEKNLPYHDAKTNIGKNVYKMVEPEHGIKLHNVLPTTEVNPNIVKKEYKNKSSKDYKLKPKISAGGFEGKGIHHRKLEERKFKNLSNNGKNVINKLVNKSFSRY